MKFYSLLVVLFPTLLFAQKSTPKYYNDINKVGKIEATNSEINIKKADQVLIKIFISDKSRLLLAEYQQVKDTSGNFISYFYFTNNEEISCDFNLLFRFSKTIIGGEIQLPKDTEGNVALNSNFSSDKMAAQFRGTATCEKGLIAIFKTSEKATVSIKGIEGIVKK